jgi:hypothetical protein
MKLLLHLAVKDLRALRGPIALWLTALAADAAFQALKLDRVVTDPNRAEAVYGALLVAGICLLVVGWVLAAMVIQLDALDSPSAFWLTRPLSWRGLLTSKLLVIVSLFLVLPTAAAAAVAAANGARGEVLVQFTLEWLVVAAALLMPMLVAASAAHNLPRMVLVASGFVGIYATVHFGTMSVPWMWANRTVDARISGLMLAIGCSVGGGAALLVHQYKTRATHRTVWLAGGLAVLAVLAGDAWPWGFVRNPATPRLDTARFDPSVVHLSVDPDSLRRSHEESGSVTKISSSGRLYTEQGAPRVAVRAVVRAEGVPPGWVVRVEQGAGYLRIDGRSRGSIMVRGIHTADTLHSASPNEPTADDVHAGLERMLEARIVNTWPTTSGNQAQLFVVPASTYLEPPGARAAFSASVSVAAHRIVLSEPIPLVPGRSCRVAGEEVTILEVTPASPLGALTLRSVRTNVWLRLLPSRQIVLRNRRTREVVFPVTEVSVRRGVGLLMKDMHLTETRASIPWQRSAVIDARWLADAELLLAAVETMGTFEKPLVLEDFTLPFAYYER